MGRGIDAALRVAWRRRMERFEASSATVTEFCRREEVSSAAFYQWRKRLTQQAAWEEDRGEADSRLAAQGRVAGMRGRGFVELALPLVAFVELTLPNGVRVRVPADQESALGAAIRAAGEVVGDADTPGEEAAIC